MRRTEEEDLDQPMSVAYCTEGFSITEGRVLPQSITKGCCGGVSRWAHVVYIVHTMGDTSVAELRGWSTSRFRCMSLEQSILPGGGVAPYVS